MLVNSGGWTCGWTGRDGGSGPKRLLETQAGNQKWELFTTMSSCVIRAGHRAHNEACIGSESASPLPLKISVICTNYLWSQVVDPDR